MAAQVCPQRDTLHGWVHGLIADDVADQVAEHLTTCAACEETVGSLQVPGMLAELSAPAGEFIQEKQCEAFVAELKNLTHPGLSSLGSDAPKELKQIRDYRLLGRLGYGGMGTVYRARHSRLHKMVAIKLLSERLSEDPTAVARFEREMQAVGQLHHPNIVQALDAGDADGTSFLVLELVEGVDLGRVTAGGESLSVADACEVGRQVAEGLQYVHDQGLVHRDIKPSNLMLSNDAGRPIVKVLDLGLAAMDGLPQQQPLTDAGQLMGTLEFMAPEQAEDTRAVDHRADIYALGATLYRLISGVVPFEEFRSPVRRLTALTTLAAPRLSDQCEELPDGLGDLIQRLLARDPALRPASMKEVAELLTPFASEHRLARLLDQANLDTKTDLTSEQTAANAGMLATGQWESTAVPQEPDVRPGRVGRRALLGLLGAAPVAALAAYGVFQAQREAVRKETGSEEGESPIAKSQAAPRPEVTRREILDWVFARQGTVVVNHRRTISHSSDVPDGDFLLSKISLKKASDDDLDQLGAWLPAYPECAKLYLGEAGGGITDNAIPSLNRIVQLVELTMTAPKLTDRGAAALRARNLGYLDLTRTQVGREGLHHLCRNLPQLPSLSFFSECVTGSDLEPLRTLKPLRSLDLNLPLATEETLLPVTKTWVQFITIRSPNIWFSSLAEPVAGMEDLQIFNLEGCVHFTERDLLAFVSCEPLRELNFRISTGLTVENVLAFLKQRPDVTIGVPKHLASSPELRELPQVQESY